MNIMRCWLTVFVACFLFVACGNSDDNQILFFTHNGCPYCDKALNFVSANYKDVPMQVLEVENPANMRKFISCADKFKLDKSRLGTPLICMGDNYILGWTKVSERKFRQYVKPFMKK